MRHSSIEITMKYYTHLRKGAEVETAAKIPDLSLSKNERQTKKLGAQLGATSRTYITYVDNDKQQTFDNEVKTGFSIGPVGFEPTTNGL